MGRIKPQFFPKDSIPKNNRSKIWKLEKTIEIEQVPIISNIGGGIKQRDLIMPLFMKHNTRLKYSVKVSVRK